MELSARDSGRGRRDGRERTKNGIETDLYKRLHFSAVCEGSPIPLIARCFTDSLWSDPDGRAPFVVKRSIQPSYGRICEDSITYCPPRGGEAPAPRAGKSNPRVDISERYPNLRTDPGFHVNPKRVFVPPIHPRIAWIVLVLATVLGNDGKGFAAIPTQPPNIVLIFVDNLGNGDIGCFGSKLHRTPNIDRLASEGTKFTSFYVASGYCTPSRAALMTGCYPRRVNLHINSGRAPVLMPVDSKGLHPDEVTIAEVLKAVGYATGIFGKWHLGDQPPFLPTRQGFDYFWGIPYSDDMMRESRPDRWPELSLMRNERVIEAPPDRNYLVKRTTEEVIAFIERHRHQPFFAYVPHTMPGSTPTPFSSPAFRGKSKNGDYGDAVEELDWSTGEIAAALKRLGLEENTLVIWTSDNGPVERDPRQGTSDPYRGFGYSTREGGMRMPCIMRWPGRIPAQRMCDELCTTMDLLPTFANLAQAPMPSAPIDGHDIRSILFGETAAKSLWNDIGFGFYQVEQLQAVRAGAWKLYLPLDKKFSYNPKKNESTTLQLFNVRDDVHEDHEVAAQHPEVVRHLLAMAERIRDEIGDTNRPGKGQRPAGKVYQPVPLRPL